MHIAPISANESARLQLLAVTADGRRVYFSTSDSATYGAAAARAQRPTHLRAQVACSLGPTVVAADVSCVCSTAFSYALLTCNIPSIGLEYMASLLPHTFPLGRAPSQPSRYQRGSSDKSI